MTGKREKKKTAVREALYTAALQQFRSRGYDAASVAEICRAAGVAKGTFFNHFPTKAHILAKWYDAAMHSAETRPIPSGISLREALQQRALNAVALARDDPGLWRAKHVYAPQDADIQAAEKRADSRIQAQAFTLLNSALDAGKVRTGVDVQAIAELYVSIVTGTIRQWLNTGEGFDLDAVLMQRIAYLVSLAAP